MNKRVILKGKTLKFEKEDSILKLVGNLSFLRYIVNSNASKNPVCHSGAGLIDLFLYTYFDKCLSHVLNLVSKQNCFCGNMTTTCI